MSRQEKKRIKNKQTDAHTETNAFKDAERFYPDPTVGLSTEQVTRRHQASLNNAETGVKTKTEKQIVLSNLFTFFNILNFILAIALVLVGSYRNTLFMGQILSNLLIGTFQEIRSKRTIDRLSLLSSPKAAVIRDGKKHDILVSEVVLDDVLLISSGNQIPADSVVTRGECEVNESLITGESDPILKKEGDHILSGSFLVSGKCLAQVEHVGMENYANQITGNAKYVKKRNSEIMNSIDMLIKIIGFGLIPIGALLFYKDMYILNQSLPDAVSHTVAALIGMIPEGLVLLTSIVFAVSIIKLSRQKTLVQDLYCVETLARVDVLCLDKTGTITEGTMQVDNLVPFEGFTEDQMAASLCALVNTLPDDNPTFLAVQSKFAGPSDWMAETVVPFSSARKWSGAFFPMQGSYIMGAGEFILGDDFASIREVVEEYSQNGQRVLLLAHSPHSFTEKEIPSDITCLGLVLISDKIRREARRTLRYFADQGVDLKIISGDNAVTVANIAERAGLQNADRYVDATTLETAEDIQYAVRNYSVFGRVTPQQKLSFVQALKADGHTVAMTGDGVNDVLALKEADCSIAMASGSDAAKTVSSLVLLNSSFAPMPLIVQEGRRSINNLQRSASLFLSKTIFSTLISLIFLLLPYSFPFEPIHLTLISTFTIGIPSFVLALEPNRERLKGSFLTNVMKLSVPAGLTMATNMLVLSALSPTFGLTNAQFSTTAVVVTALTGFIMLFKVCAPFNALRGFVFLAMLAASILAMVFAGDFFSLVSFTIPMSFILIITFVYSVSLMLSLIHFIDHVLSRKQNFFSTRKVFYRKPKQKKSKRHS
ncbi:HAD-IC family P-type ATPase [Scatolibacter rhodanostii]|uniref:HAD-IC family P-type ATPase n=1 Tax=Scatolibacter rhodanostii TaxID=2014781 RepID=UPI000C06F46C|nr:HAD-IC family P-type ATPase [Scatolibacter rhodanostii]